MTNEGVEAPVKDSTEVLVDSNEEINKRLDAHLLNFLQLMEVTKEDSNVPRSGNTYKSPGGN